MAKVQIKFDKLSPLRAFLGEEYYNILCAANKSMNLMVETLLSTAHQQSLLEGGNVISQAVILQEDGTRFEIRFLVYLQHQ